MDAVLFLQNTKVHLEPCGFWTQDNCPNSLSNASADDFVQLGFSSKGALAVIIVLPVFTHPSSTSIRPVPHFSHFSSATSNSVLTFPNNIYRHYCYFWPRGCFLGMAFKIVEFLMLYTSIVLFLTYILAMDLTSFLNNLPTLILAFFDPPCLVRRKHQWLGRLCSCTPIPKAW